MEKSFTNILVNSTLAFVSAFTLTTIFHESGHYLSYSLFGANPVLFHNFVQTTQHSLSTNVRIVSALAGPFFSLLQGLLCSFIILKNKGNSAAHLFILWLGLLGFVNFFGYLVMTPFSTAGDTGKVAELLNIDFVIRIIIALLGFFILLRIIAKVAKSFSNFIPEQTDRGLRARYVYRLMFFPVIIGSFINVFLALPVVSILSIMYPATSSYVIMSAFPVILRSSVRNTTKPEFENRIIKSLVILTLSAVIINRLLTLGIG